MTDTQSNTRFPPRPTNVPRAIHPEAPWKDQKYSCVHCHREFPSYSAKNAHLSHCKMRLLNRYFKVQTYIFTVNCNPLKRKIFAINDEIMETHDAKVIVGLLKGFMRYGIIATFTVTELEGNEETLKYPDGMIRFPVLKKLLSSKDFTAFQTSLEEVKNQKVEMPVRQTTN